MLEDRHGNAKRQEIPIIVIVGVREVGREQAVVLPREVGVRLVVVIGRRAKLGVGTEVFGAEVRTVEEEHRRQAQPGSVVGVFGVVKLGTARRRR
jgi:hypothetical protein